MNSCKVSDQRSIVVLEANQLNPLIRDDWF